jgi:hypothetical protein
MIDLSKSMHAGALFCAALLFSGCASPSLRVGDGGISEEGLQRLEGTAFDEAWARPGIDVRRFEALVLDQVSVSYRDAEDGVRERSLVHRANQSAFAIPEHEKERIQQRFERRLSESLERSPSFRYSADPVPGALLVRASLVDYVSSVPREDGMTGRSQVWVSSVGEATLVVELWDAARDELLVRAIDHEKMEPGAARLVRGDTVTSVAEIDRQMQRWARDLRAVLDQLHGLAGTEPSARLDTSSATPPR